MIRRSIAIVPLTLLVLAVLTGGCSTSTDLSGVRVPNSQPDTRITGQPPTLLEAGFAVDFNWTGSDPDGKIVGYEWKISDNGVDGISPRDTLTVDPLTGAVINPWRFTTGNDSTFLVLADQADFPGDEHNDPRSFRTHSIFIRAVDDKGAVDPSPAYMSFTSTTLVPTCRVVYKDLAGDSYKVAPPTVNVGWTGEDPDFDLKIPTQVRFLWKSARIGEDDQGEPIYVRTRNQYNQNRDELINFEDPDWEPWIRFEPNPDDREAQFPEQPDGEFFLFAIQVRDTAGAVSIDRNYQREVAHFWVRSGFYRPFVTLGEPFLGTPSATERFSEVAGGQPINFVWSANAEAYNGKIVSYRHGWDLVDPTDANDPGWAVPPGLSKQNLFDKERSFQSGLHTFYLKVIDDSNQERLMIWRISVIPFVQRQFQLPLLVLDQTVDRNVQNWPDQNGEPRNDERFRNAFWEFLGGGSGGVADVAWERDWRDHVDLVTFSDLVKYKAVLCYAQNNTNQLMFNEFRPTGGPINGQDRFVWLTPYQEKGGNFFLTGGSSMESFLENSSLYMVPIIFNTRETSYNAGNTDYVVGFGQSELPDGTRVERGPGLYPYATAGIAALDWTSPDGKTIYSRNILARFDRHVDCVGLKGLVLDDEFRTYHGIGPGVIADTMYTNTEIDWHDTIDAQADTLALFHGTFPFRNDEFYDYNISTTRATPLIPQECKAPDYLEGPNGLCVQPMFRGIARFDWIREIRFTEGETDWPSSRYTDFELDDECGRFALTSYEGVDRSSALTNNRNFGFFSYKTARDKPGKKADVYWGFDPYRFNHEESRKAIRWVMQYFGLAINP